MVREGWDVEPEHCPLYLTSLLGQSKEYGERIRTIPEPGMPEPVCKSCGVPQRIASTNIAATVLGELSCLNTDSQPVTHSSKKVIPRGMRWIDCTIAAETCY